MSTQNLTVQIDTKVSNAGITKVTQQAKSMVDSVQKTFDRIAQNDPFARLARGDQVTKRLKSTVAQLHDIGSGVSLAKKSLEEFFGINAGEKVINRSLGLIKDRINDIRISASKISLGGDAGPLLNKLRRVDAEVRRVKSAAGGMMSAAFGSFSAAGGGAMELTRGLSMLTAGTELEKVATAMLTFDASVSVFRGSKAVFTNTIGGIINSVNSLAAMSAAGKLSRELAGIVGGTGAMASIAGGLRARHAIGLIGGGFAGAALGGDWLGTGIGAVAGLGAAHMMPSVLSFMGGSAAASAAIPILGTAGLAALAFHNSPALQDASAGLSHYVPRWIPQFHGLSSFSPEAPHDPTAGNLDVRMLDLDASNAALHRMQLAAGRDAASFQRFGLTSRDIEAREANAAIFGANEQRAELHRNFDVQFYGGIAGMHTTNVGNIHERQLGRQSLTFSDAMALTGRGDATRDVFARAEAQSAELGRLAGIGGVGSASARGRVAAAQAQVALAQNDFSTADSQARTMRANLARSIQLQSRKDEIIRTLNGVQGNDAEVDRLLRLRDRTQDANGRSAIDVQLYGIGRTSPRRAGLQAELGRVQTELEAIGTINMDKVDEADKRREASARRIQEAQNNLNSSKQQEREIALQTLATEGKRYEEISRTYTLQAKTIKDQQRGSASSFGLMTEEDQMRAAGIARQLRAGQSLDRDDIQFARGIEPLQGMLGSLGREQAARNGYFAEIERSARPGEMSRNELLAENERRAQANQEQAVKIENNLRVQAEVNVRDMANDLEDQLLPRIQELETSIMTSLRNALGEIARRADQLLLQQQGAQNAGNQH